MVPRTTTMTRHGCSWLALLAASIAISASCSPVTMTRVSTRPRAIGAAALAQVDELAVDGGRRGARQVDDHGILQTRPSRAISAWADGGPQVPDSYCSGLPVRGPVPLDRVEDLPGQLDLLLAREERRVAQQDVQDQPLVGLGRGLGEGVAVAEVHRDVADLHRGARAPWTRTAS